MTIANYLALLQKLMEACGERCPLPLIRGSMSLDIIICDRHFVYQAVQCLSINSKLFKLFLLKKMPRLLLNSI